MPRWSLSEYARKGVLSPSGRSHHEAKSPEVFAKLLLGAIRKVQHFERAVRQDTRELAVTHVWEHEVIERVGERVGVVQRDIHAQRFFIIVEQDVNLLPNDGSNVRMVRSVSIGQRQDFEIGFHRHHAEHLFQELKRALDWEV